MNLTNVINNQLARIGVEVSIRKIQGLYRGLFKGKLNRLSHDDFLMVTYSNDTDNSCHFQISVGKYLTAPIGFLTKSDINTFNNEHKNTQFPISFINEGNKLIHLSSGANIEFNSIQELITKVSLLLKDYIDVLETGIVDDVFIKYETETELRMMAF